jgi:hypothetical protein
MRCNCYLLSNFGIFSVLFQQQERASQQSDRVHPDSVGPDSDIPELAPLNSVAHERTRLNPGQRNQLNVVS